MDLRKQDDERSKKHWEFVAAAATKVESWPRWKQAAVLTATEADRQKQVEEQQSVGEAYAAD